LIIEPMHPAHGSQVLEIYQQGLDTGLASFEVTAPGWGAFSSARLPNHRFVALDGPRVVGWIAVSPVSTRPVYAGVVEHSVYVAAAARGRGIGRALLDELIRSTEDAGIWTIQAGVFPENVGSLTLHARAGFRTVGVRRKVGRHHGVWRDVVLLERRSAKI
jgi:L-amino acid N-acyltransferase YncA